MKKTTLYLAIMVSTIFQASNSNADGVKSVLEAAKETNKTIKEIKRDNIGINEIISEGFEAKTEDLAAFRTQLLSLKNALHRLRNYYHKDTEQNKLSSKFNKIVISDDNFKESPEFDEATNTLKLYVDEDTTFGIYNALDKSPNAILDAFICNDNMPTGACFDIVEENELLEYIRVNYEKLFN